MLQTEIRQPCELPVIVNVPEFPKLVELKARAEGFKREAADYNAQIALLTREYAELNRDTLSAYSDSSIFKRLAEIKRELTQLETKLAGATSQAVRIDDESRQWVEEFAWKLYRRQLLARELGEASDEPQPQMRTYAIGETKRRPKLEILAELDACVCWLATWTGDGSFMQELASVKAQLAEAYQQ